MQLDYFLKLSFHVDQRVIHQNFSTGLSNCVRLLYIYMPDELENEDREMACSQLRHSFHSIGCHDRPRKL